MATGVCAPYHNTYGKHDRHDNNAVTVDGHYDGVANHDRDQTIFDHHDGRNDNHGHYTAVFYNDSAVRHNTAGYDTVDGHDHGDTVDKHDGIVIK